MTDDARERAWAEAHPRMTVAERKLLDTVIRIAASPGIVRADNRERDRLGWNIAISRAADDVLRERGLLRASRRRPR